MCRCKHFSTLQQIETHKTTISSPAQSYLCVSIDQNKVDSNYQSTQKDKLGNFIQSLLSAGETVAIVKYSEHAIKVQDNFVVLEDESLTNATQLP